MLILNDASVQSLGADWHALTDCIEQTVRLMDDGDYVQPLKPYLRYGDTRNRIIAMPAYLGGAFQSAGLKWIASFPGNRDRGLPRAHGVTVLNRADTGQPFALLYGGMPNLLRTAAVSGLVLRLFAEARPRERFRIAIIGWGPVGRTHMDMCIRLFGDRIDRFSLYDQAGIGDTGIAPGWRDRTSIADSWQEAYGDCNVCITCTVSDRRYIDRAPPGGSLLLNVSLRDYEAAALRNVKHVVVDDWDEVCRENTDIELLHRTAGLTRQMTASLADVVCRGGIRLAETAESVLFCPMGMAVFDIAVCSYLVHLAEKCGAGVSLPDA